MFFYKCIFMFYIHDIHGCEHSLCMIFMAVKIMHAHFFFFFLSKKIKRAYYLPLLKSYKSSEESWHEGLRAIFGL